ncbi:MAG TPA: serine/threonine-protein kinase [Gemmatimonadales bacterium]|nr:serine/threonine-protein kinase [Gemmatimonadales bacterium]
MAVALHGCDMRSALPHLQEPAAGRTTQHDERLRLVAAVRGRYDIQRELGRGGMSSVFLAWDRLGRRRVAIKVLAPGLSLSVEYRERFRREAWITTRLAHPNIVACYDFVRCGDVVYAVMPYIAGRSLAALLAGGRRLDPAEAVAIFAPIADALAHAHAIGVVHRDMKPANILLQRSTGRPYLADFGIATLRTSEHSRSEVTKRFGTPEFMSPEQALGAWDADHRGDIYSLGLVAYLALAGRMPFPGGSPVAHAAQRTVLDAPPLRSMAPEVPARLAAVVDRCLARRAERRWQSAAALQRALRQSLSVGFVERWVRALKGWLAVTPRA